MTDWMTILQKNVEQKGGPLVQRELDISAATLSLVLNDKYPANPAKIAKKVMDIYGIDGSVKCPVCGTISPTRCIENYKRAQKIRTAGNPDTIRLYAACRKCDFRG